MADKKDYTLDGDTISQDYKKYNNTKYVKKFHTFSTQNRDSTDITDTMQNYKLGDFVLVSDKSSKRAGKKGKICIGFSLENPSDMLCILFKDGKKEMIDKSFLNKICEQDYNE